MTTSTKESPLRRPPLRQAGQSLQEEIDRVWNDKILDPIVLGFGFLTMAIFEWCGWFFNLPRRPSIPIIITVAYGVFTWIRLRPILKKYRQLKLGRDGERTVGQELEKLRASGYRVYHDFIGDNFNIDHLVIGPTGVFTINTKTISKPKSRDAKIDYDGSAIRVPGTSFDRDPITNSIIERDFLRNWIKEKANRCVQVRSAIVFVGWYVNKQPAGAEVWVLNVTGLMSFIQNERSELSHDDIVYLCGILEGHILQRQELLSNVQTKTWS